MSERAQELLPGGVLGRHRYPAGYEHIFASGEGARVTDIEGRSYIDYSCGGGALILGYSHPAITQAIVEQSKRSTQFISILNDEALALAERMREAVPWIEMLRFALSGSEAVMFSVRLARAFTKRDRILRFAGAYHGNSDVALVGGGGCDPATWRGSVDSAGIPEVVSDLVLVAPYNDVDALQAVFARHGREMAAVVVEPVQRTYRAEPRFLDALRRLTREHGSVLIFDEIVTGFRHALGGAAEAFGITPDVSVFAKALGGGVPISAVAGRKEILDHADPARENAEGGFCYVTSSQSGNPLGCAAALAVLDMIGRPGALRAMHERAEALKKGLREIVRKRGSNAIVVGDGPLWDLAFGVDAVRDHASARRQDHAKLRGFHQGLVRHGVMVRIGGRSYFSLAHGDDEVASTLRAAEAALAEVGA